MTKSIALIGAPGEAKTFEARRGTRRAGLLHGLRAAGFQVDDFGDVPAAAPSDASGDLAAVATVARWVGKRAWRAHGERMLPLLVADDHTAALGSIAASAQCVPGVGLVWVDAHPAFHTLETSPNGSVRGMALATVAGRGPEALARRLGLTPLVHPERIVVIGARSMDAVERHNLRQSGVRVYEMDYLAEHGIRATVEDALAYLARRQVRAVHLSVGLDVLDPLEGSWSSTRDMTIEDLALAARTVAETTPIAALDVVGSDQQTANRCRAADACVVAVQSFAVRVSGSDRRHGPSRVAA